MRTKALKPADYISTAGQLSLTRLVDHAVEALGVIRCNGVGQHSRRSRGVILRSFRSILMTAGYTESQADQVWRDQVRALDELAANAEE